MRFDFDVIFGRLPVTNIITNVFLNFTCFASQLIFITL